MRVSVEHPLISRLDAAGERLADRYRGRPVVDRVMYTFSHVGDMSLIWHTAGVAGALRRDDDIGYAVRLSVVQGIEAVLVNGPVKSIFDRVRPTEPTERPLHLRRPRTSSFPSGHASAAACAVVMLSEGAGPIERVAWSLLGAGVATSRVYVGVHHASDVVAGAAVGAVIGLAARRWWPLR
jgi:membrane-associated phospholipid phosphatase